MIRQWCPFCQDITNQEQNISKSKLIKLTETVCLKCNMLLAREKEWKKPLADRRTP